jgi:lysophospholipase L1-like esterase
MFDEGITPMRGRAPEGRRPGIVMAGMLLRVVGILLCLLALLFNRYVLSIFDPTPPLDIVTAHGIWAAQKAYFLSGLLLLLFAEAVNPSTTHRLFKRAFSRRLTLNLLLLLLSLAVPILILELALRPFTIDHLPQKSTTIFVKDQDLGWKLRPRSRGSWGGVEVQINSGGLRGPEIPHERKQRALRILYLGDSVTFGYKLPRYDMSFPYAVEKQLEQGKRIEVETINAGVGGYAPWQYDAYLRKESVKFQPDVVLVGFVLNDVTGKFNLVRFGDTRIGFQLTKSYHSIDDWLAHNIAIYATIHRIRTRLQFGQDPQRGAIAQELVAVEELALYPDSQRVKKAWDVTLENLGRLVEYCQEEDLQLLVVVFPYTFQFEDPSSLDSPQRVLASFCHDRNIPCLDFLTLLSRHIHERNLTPRDLFLDTVHLSDKGGKVAAGFIVKFLEQEIFLDDSSPD